MSGRAAPPFDFRELTFALILHQRAVAEKLGLNLTDFKALGLLHRRGDMMPKGLAAAIGMSAAATTSIIDRLEAAGYVERRRGRGDRRSLSVHAVPAGAERVERLYHSLRVLAERANASYSERELKVIFGYLAEATEILRKATAQLHPSFEILS